MIPIHPLVKQSARELGTEENVVTVLKATTDDVPAGRYDFAIYQWQFHGIKEDMILKPIALNGTLTEHLSRLLEDAVDSGVQDANPPPRRDELETHHHQQWATVREEHRQRAQALATYQSESLTTSHRARIELVREQLRQATSEKIRRMKQSQIDSAEADYNRRIRELNDAMERAEITAMPVAYGILEVEGNY